jgi:DNA-binding GntR family transcriptional regulator
MPKGTNRAPSSDVGPETWNSGTRGLRGVTTPYERLKTGILNGTVAPGEPLVEVPLAEWLGVSRTPVREALTRLEQDGLVVRTSRGLVVRERSPEEILDIYETRIVLEATAARTAAERRSDVDMMALRRAAAELHSMVDPSENEMASSNRSFHRTVWRAAHNEAVFDLLERLDHHLSRFPATTLSQPGRWAAANAEHDAIIDAIEARDGVRASELTAAHFTAARNIRLELWGLRAT